MTKVIHRGNGKVFAVRRNKANQEVAKLVIPKLDLSFGVLPDNHEFSRPKDFDCRKLPWPFQSDSVEEAYSGFMLNRIPGKERMAWMAELWRVLVPNGKCKMLVPYWGSPRSVQDPASEWPPIAQESFHYFNKGFRDTNKEPSEHYCDFDFVMGLRLYPDTANRNDESRQFWATHYLYAVQDLEVTLTKRPKGD